VQDVTPSPNEVIRIEGGAQLIGRVRVGGAKNSALKLMAASLMATGRTTLRDVPEILDVAIMSELLRRLGCEVAHDPSERILTIDVPEGIRHQADYDLVRKMRASTAVLGPLLARTDEADVALPGGDAIGSRGLDIHIAGLVQMGAEVSSEHGYLHAKAPNGLHGADIALEFPSVGASETLILAGVLAKGVTRLDNIAREPEVMDLCRFLLRMGAQIEGIDEAEITIHGVESLKPTEYTVVPDRIVTGTWAVATAMTGGQVVIENACPEFLEMPLEKLAQAGARITSSKRELTVASDGALKAVDVVTLPYPGFPTDLQPHFIALNSVAEGSAMVTENVFEARFRFVQELVRLGADVHIDGHHCFIRGKARLSGAPVEGSDIRAAAALVCAGLVAEGTTVLSDVVHLDRGYEGFAPALRGLGAVVSRESA
jgi:UDP-N-acetylglucosamine 1-carboxyvinyltransferase